MLIILIGLEDWKRMGFYNAFDVDVFDNKGLRVSLFRRGGYCYGGRLVVT